MARPPFTGAFPVFGIMCYRDRAYTSDLRADEQSPLGCTHGFGVF